VGETVAERWNLPARYVAAIAHHHDPDAAGGEARFCALIGLADQAAHAAHAAHASSAAGPLAPAREQEKAARMADLRLGPADWDDCLRRLHEAEAEIEGFTRTLR
jgi:HD-like signal output (HDOD) protein